MSRIKTALMALACTVITVGTLFAAHGVGNSTAQVFDDLGNQRTDGLPQCLVDCIENGPLVWRITSQNLQWNNGQLGLTGGNDGRVQLTQNGGGTYNVEITLPANLQINGINYQRQGDVILDGEVDSWPVGTNEYTLRNTVEFTNGIEVLHISAGAKLNLSVQ